MSQFALKKCPSGRVHPEHKWWSRAHKRYFMCSGKERAR